MSFIKGIIGPHWGELEEMIFRLSVSPGAEAAQEDGQVTLPCNITHLRTLFPLCFVSVLRVFNLNSNT